MTGIEFKALWWDESQSQLSDLGVRPDITGADTRLVTFFRIDTISPYIENDIEYTAIRSGGDEYIIPQRYHEVKNCLSMMDIIK